MKTNIILGGKIGTGKTTAVKTLLPHYLDHKGREQRGAGLRTFLISHEPGADAALQGHLCGTHEVGDPIHWQNILPISPGWSTAKKWATLAQTLSMEDLTQKQDPDRRQYTGLLDLYTACSAFVCAGCSEHFGAVDEWGEDRAIVCDGLTGLTEICKQVICGGSPFLSLPKIYGIQGIIATFINNLFGATKCSAILTAHIERETSPLTGLPVLALSTIGQKLSPRLTKLADEVINARRDKGEYTWSTEEDSDEIEVKHRRLPPGSNLPPTFAQLFKHT